MLTTVSIPSKTKSMIISEERFSAYAAINSERYYQNLKWGQTKSSDQPGAGERSIDEFALYIQGYTNDLTQVASHFGSPKDKLEIIRKIAALCVHCMEQHGSINRVVPIDNQGNYIK